MICLASSYCITLIVVLALMTYSPTAVAWAGAVGLWSYCLSYTATIALVVIAGTREATTAELKLAFRWMLAGNVSFIIQGFGVYLLLASRGTA